MDATNYEIDRVNDLMSYSIMDTPHEISYDQLAYLAAISCETPVALISFIDHERQWFKSSFGLSLHEIPKQTSMCIKTIEQEDVIVIPDMRENKEYADNYYVVEKKFVFYAGVPLISKQGHKLGTLCVLDWKPHNLSVAQIATLKILAAQICDQNEMRKLYRESLKDIWTLSKSKQEMEHRYQGIIYAAKLRALSELSSGISFKIQDPLRMIKGSNDQLNNLLEDSTHSKKLIDEELELIEKNCKRISDVLESLSVFKKIHNTEGMKPLDLRSLIQDVANLLLPKMIQEKHFTLELNEDVIIIGNELQLGQAFSGFFTNACEAIINLSEKKMNVSLRKEGKFAVVRVSDFGLGIQEEIRDFIFQPFFSLKEEELHPGLGLSIGKTIIERHSGTIEIESNHNPTILALKLPLPAT
jgi:signal transduction histidine kinase